MYSTNRDRISCAGWYGLGFMLGLKGLTVSQLGVRADLKGSVNTASWVFNNQVVQHFYTTHSACTASAFRSRGKDCWRNCGGLPVEISSHVVACRLAGGQGCGSSEKLADGDPFCEQVFYGFGVMGLVWVFWWERLVADMAVQEPEVVEQLQKTVPMGASGEATQDSVPWRAFIRNVPLRALAYTHFTNNW